MASASKHKRLPRMEWDRKCGLKKADHVPVTLRSDVIGCKITAVDLHMYKKMIIHE